jgi:hypothetical protein
MFVYECLLAITLLTAPPGSVDLTDPPPNFEALQPILQHLAVQWEILDAREIRYVLARAEDFQADMKLLRRRYRNLSDAPRLHECERLPDRTIVNDMLTFNRAYRQFLVIRQPLDLIHGDELRTALNETDRLYQIWDAVRDARCNYYYVTVRRQALKQLREMVGVDAFYRGYLPPHVPVWRFPEID